MRIVATGQNVSRRVQLNIQEHTMSFCLRIQVRIDDLIVREAMLRGEGSKQRA